MLRSVPAFSSLEEKTLYPLVGTMEEIPYSAGQEIVREGDPGDRAFLIVEGSAEVSTAGVDRKAILATLFSGELFGEIALLSESGRRTATVTAVTPLRVLSLSGEVFKRLIAENPLLRAQFDDAAKGMFRMRFLKLCASPFSALPSGQFRELSGKLKPLRVPAGAAVVRQGEEGDSCFVIQEGQVAVVLEKEGCAERQLATLGPGALFGEAALLTAAPRNTTVRALEPCELLVLKRADLIEVLGKTPELGFQFKELLQLRSRPCQIPEILIFPNKSAAGETTTVLKNPLLNTYYRLSPQGWFIWQRLDGHHTLKDLTLEYLGEFKAFAPQAIAEILSGLARAGFVQSPAFRSGVMNPDQRLSLWQRLVKISRGLLEFQWTFKNADGPLGNFYKAGIYLLYTRAGQIILGAVSLAGLLVFFANVGGIGPAVRASSPWLALVLIPAEMLTLVIHEAGHAFTTKAVGREILGVGVGWYWFGPVAFVDTSDTWLASRRQRIAVSLAGPYANLILGSVLALAACGVPDPVTKIVLWQLSFSSYIMVILNLDPLLEYDGYYILTDLLDRPNLRSQTLGWLGKDLLPNLTNGRVLRAHLFDILFGLGSVLYVIAVGGMTFLFYRVFLQQWLVKFIPLWLASGLAWGLTGSVILMSFISVLSELRPGKNSESRLAG